MKRYFLHISLLSILLCSFAGDAFSYDKEKAKMLKDEAKECAICHYEFIPQIWEGNGTEIVEYVPGRFVGAERLCYGCHNGGVLDSRWRSWKMKRHPLVVPSDKVRITPEYPLNEKGEMYCCTCHSGHGVQTDASTDSAKVDYERTIFLRRSNNNSEMCMECHVNKTTGMAGGTHPILVDTIKLPEKLSHLGGFIGDKPDKVICQSCHSVHGSDVDKLLVAPIKNAELCVICHYKKNAYTKIGALNKGTHPVNIFSDTVKIPEKIEEMGGKTGSSGKIICLSCHTVHKGLPNNKLVLGENSDSSFCLVCHTEQKTLIETKHDLRKSVPNEQNNLGDLPSTKGPCSACHLPHNGTANKMWAKERVTEGDIIEDLCKSCHDKKQCAGKKPVGYNSHPIGAPLANVGGSRSDLPTYDEFGEKVKNTNVTCSTCHNVHQWDPRDKDEKGAMNEEGTYSNSFLRIKNLFGIRLCTDCHKPQEFIFMTDHDLTVTAPEEKNINNQTAKESGPCGACHTVHNALASNKLWARPLGDAEDAISMFCFSCHAEGQVGSKKLVGEHSHPVMADIRKADGTTTLPRYKINGKKDENGAIVCSSCHNLHQWDPSFEGQGPGENTEGDQTNSFLRIQNDENASLCNDCHEGKYLVEDTDHDMNVTAPEEKNLVGKTVAETGTCSACHTVHNGVSSFKLWARELGGNQKDDGITRLCFSCHQEGRVGEKKQVGENSHPVDADIKRADGTTDMPLFNEKGAKASKYEPGKVYCSSCHNVHQWDPAKKEKGPKKLVEGDIKNSFLRLPNDAGSTLCKNCHEGKNLVEATDHDMSIVAPDERNAKGEKVEKTGPCGACHIVHNGVSKFKLWGKKLGGEISDDGISRLCFSCHQEGRVGEKKLVGEHSHPVNADMFALGEETDLPLYSIDGVRDDQGKVFCSTCHNLHQWDPTKMDYGPGENQEGNRSNSFLRLPNTSGSTLCMNCHKGKVYVEGTDHDLSITAPLEENIIGETVDLGGPCSACHVVHNGLTQAFLWARPVGVGEDIVSKLCTSCHLEGRVGEKKTLNENTHPVGSRISRADGTTSYPVFNDDGKRVNAAKDGKVFCSSCHNVHQWDPEKADFGPGENIEGDAKTSFLRGADIDLCLDCHNRKDLIIGTEHDLSITAPEEKNLLGQTVADAGVCSACHVVHNGVAAPLIWSRPLGPAYIGEWKKIFGADEDFAVQACTSCHSEGNIADSKQPIVGLHPRSLFIGIKKEPFIAKDEPIPPLYDVAGRRLTTGNLICPTCHNLHQWNGRKKKRGPGKNLEGNANNSFLRSGVSFGLCTDCHSFDGLFRYKYYHVPRMRNKNQKR
ncbi:cytochrome c3 family protein [Thermodesulfobacteriota bacterium]